MGFWLGKRHLPTSDILARLDRMYRIVCIILLAFVVGAGTTRADSIYKWVDAQGNVHYSDHPRPGSQKVQLPRTQTYTPPSSAADVPAASFPASASAPTAAYTQFSITSPASQANLWYVHQVTVSVSVSPSLQSGDTITYHLDGQTIGPTTNTSATFKHIYRGTHTASATLHAANGASLSAGPVTFYVHQKTILGPKSHH